MTKVKALLRGEVTNRLGCPLFNKVSLNFLCDETEPVYACMQVVANIMKLLLDVLKR